MNESSEKRRDPTDDESRELLDRLTHQLREQPVPPPPAACRNWSPRTEVARAEGRSPIRRSSTRAVVSWSVAAMGAAFLLAVASWALLQNPGNQNRHHLPDRVVVKDEAGQTEKMGAGNAPDTAVWDELQEGLGVLDEEIAQLKRQAELLDVRRRAELLMDDLATVSQPVPVNVEEL